MLGLTELLSNNNFQHAWYIKGANILLNILYELPI